MVETGVGAVEGALGGRLGAGYLAEQDAGIGDEEPAGL